jgi:uncharacterized protein YkvS
MAKITLNLDSLKSRREWKRLKVQDGSNVFRILPPFGDVEVHNNYPYRKWSTVWLTDPGTGKRRPFASPMTDGAQKCPVKEYNEDLTKYIDKKKTALEAKGLSPDKVKTALEDLREVQWQIKVQHVYAYNAADKSGEVGLLELKSTAHQGVKKCMNQYIKEYGQDPTSLNSADDDSGVWLDITKEGDGKNTEYDAKLHQLVHKDKTTGKVTKEDDRSALSDNIVDNYADVAYDLNAVYTRKNYDELRELLLYNLAIIAENCPEAVLPGYEIDGITVDTPQEDEPEEVPAPVAKKSAAKVTLKLDDADDEQVIDVVKAKPAQKGRSTSNSARMSDSDIMRMADDILGE